MSSSSTGDLLYDELVTTFAALLEQLKHIRGSLDEIKKEIKEMRDELHVVRQELHIAREDNKLLFLRPRSSV